MKTSLILCLSIILICLNISICNSDKYSKSKNGSSKKELPDTLITKKSDQSQNIHKDTPKKSAITPGNKSTTEKIPDLTNNDKNVSCVNGTSCEIKKPDSSYGGVMTGIYNTVAENKDMLLRTLYVLIGVTAIVIVYFIVRAWRLRRKRKARKYGIITTPASDLEMAPLGDGEEDEEDDMTVFEMSPKHQAR